MSATLYALAGALGVALATLLAERIGTEIASEGGARRAARRHRGHHPDGRGSTGCGSPPGPRRESTAHGPGVTEHLVLVAGALRVGRVAEEVTLAPGQSATWGSDVAHSYAAVGDAGADAVLVIRSRRRSR